MVFLGQWTSATWEPGGRLIKVVWATPRDQISLVRLGWGTHRFQVSPARSDQDFALARSQSALSGIDRPSSPIPQPLRRRTPGGKARPLLGCFGGELGVRERGQAKIGFRNL